MIDAVFRGQSPQYGGLWVVDFRRSGDVGESGKLQYRVGGVAEITKIDEKSSKIDISTGRRSQFAPKCRICDENYKKTTQHIDLKFVSGVSPCLKVTGKIVKMHRKHFGCIEIS